MKQFSKTEQKKLLIEIMDDDSKLGLYSVKHVSIRLFLYIAIALVPVGCGTRKVATSVTNTKTSDTEKESSKGNVSNTSTGTSSAGSTTANNLVNEKQEQRVTELFNENGTLKQRITELLNTKSTDNTVKTNYINTRYYNHTDSVFNNNYYHKQVITIHEKQKATSTNRGGLYYLGGFAVLIAGLLAWLKWVRK